MKSCIIVTSVVEISNSPLDWSAVRSIYTHKQRFEQTLETIESIRKHLPDTHIILAECSPESDYMMELKKRVDIFINTYPNDLIQNGFRKSVCEAKLLLNVFNSVDLSQYQHIFKMTGRYKLLDSFDKNVWMDYIPICCMTDWYSSAAKPPPHIHTFFYKITNQELPLIKKTFEDMVNTDTSDAIEHILYHTLKHRIKHIDKIGIEVRLSCYEGIRQA